MIPLSILIIIAGALATLYVVNTQAALRRLRRRQEELDQEVRVIRGRLDDEILRLG